MIKEIKEALEKVLPGKWERTGEGWFNVPNCAKIVVKDEWGQTYIAQTYAGNHQEANANLIANAPEYLRYLLNEIERKDKALQDVREAVWDEVVPSKLAAKVNWIVEEGLK